MFDQMGKNEQSKKIKGRLEEELTSLADRKRKTVSSYFFFPFTNNIHTFPLLAVLKEERFCQAKTRHKNIKKKLGLNFLISI